MSEATGLDHVAATISVPGDAWRRASSAIDSVIATVTLGLISKRRIGRLPFQRPVRMRSTSWRTVGTNPLE